MAKRKLNVSMIISGYVNELIAKLHTEYPHTEWSGIGRIIKQKGYYELVDIRFPEQSNVSAETEMSDKGIETLLEDIFDKTPEQMGEWKCRLHSHHTMGVFRSATDDTARRGFNDGQQDYRWSIVTAYTTEGNITYKCALDVFKPIIVSFDVEVKAEKIDYDAFLKKNMKDYDLFMKAFNKLQEEKQKALSQVDKPYVATAEDITELIEIFNVEANEENVLACSDMLNKKNKDKHKLNMALVKSHYDDEEQELISFFDGGIFDDKLKELKDNIVSPYAYSSFDRKLSSEYAQGGSWNTITKAREYPNQTSLFPDADTKYNNHTDKKTFSSFNNGNDDMRGYYYGD